MTPIRSTGAAFAAPLLKLKRKSILLVSVNHEVASCVPNDTGAACSTSLQPPCHWLRLNLSNGYRRLQPMLLSPILQRPAPFAEKAPTIQTVLLISFKGWPNKNTQTSGAKLGRQVATCDCTLWMNQLACLRGIRCSLPGSERQPLPKTTAADS